MVLVPTGPLDDTREPTFAKGQWFGGVPHTRVVIIAPAASGTWSMLIGGILLGFADT